MTAKNIKCSSVDVAMIVYNEADIISKSLLSLMEAGFDSFVLLDMHSSDDTVNIAKSMLGDKCKVNSISRRHLIENGFAEARNICASFCERQWILFIDADEVITEGIVNKNIIIDEVGTNKTVYAIGRDNLSSNPSDPQKFFVKSSEKHNRLYQHKFWQKWVGYIHEEIFNIDSSRHTYNGHSALKIDHYSELKSTKDGDSKAGLYALMLLRAYNFPAVRSGTNPWWYETYVPDHLPTLLLRAEGFAIAENIPKSFYDATTASIENNDPASLAKTFSADSDEEITVNCQDIRTIHSLKSDTWTGQASRVLWYEWNHPGEGSRTLSSIVSSTQAFHWHKFIKPGRVSIDIGGHSGDTAIPMGLFCFDRIKNEKGHVVVVEPNPAVIPVLDCNLAMNTHIANFYSIPAAITAEDMDEIELADHGNSQCNGGVLKSGLSADVAQKLHDVAIFRYKAPGISMRTLFESAKSLSNGQPIGFVKLDCEGYDKEIIRPCKELLAEDKPVLFIQWFDWFEDEDDADLFAVIESIDYVPFNPTSLEPSALNNPTSDILCVHKSLVGAEGRL